MYVNGSGQGRGFGVHYNLSVGDFTMRKLTFAAAAAAILLYAPLAQAATVFNFTFTGGLATLGDPASVNGTGKVTVDGLTGSGFESATKGGGMNQ